MSTESSPPVRNLTILNHHYVQKAYKSSCTRCAALKIWKWERRQSRQRVSGSTTGKCTSWPITFPPSLWTPARIPFLCSYSISSFKTPLMPPLSTVTLSSSALTESVGQHYHLLIFILKTPFLPAFLCQLLSILLNSSHTAVLTLTLPIQTVLLLSSSSIVMITPWLFPLYVHSLHSKKSYFFPHLFSPSSIPLT